MISEEVEQLQALVTKLENELKVKGKVYYALLSLHLLANQVERSIIASAVLVSSQETEIRSLQRKLARRDNEILRQGREIHKLRVGHVMVASYCHDHMVILCSERAAAGHPPDGQWPGLPPQQHPGDTHRHLHMDSVSSACPCPR